MKSRWGMSHWHLQFIALVRKINVQKKYIILEKIDLAFKDYFGLIRKAEFVSRALNY